MSWLAPLLVLLAALGGGAGLLRLAGILGSLRPAEQVTWSATLGLGLIGWIAFLLPFVHGFNASGFAALTAVLLPGLALLRPAACALSRFRPNRRFLGVAAVALLCVLAGLTVALAPMADADTLAYHFALPKWALEQSAPVFVPRAADGAVPQLLHMTFAAIMALGGLERAPNLWAWTTGLLLPALAYSSLRRWLTPAMALAGALALATLPAAVYGAVSGQVEVRMALFVLVMVLGVAEAARTGRAGFAVIAGFAAGFVAGCKFTGLLLVAAAGLTLVALAPRRPLLPVLFGIAALAAGGQWYGWMWAHSGDPFFPLLWGHVPYAAGFPWNDAQQVAFKSFAANELALPRSAWTMLAYPFQATFAPLPAFESGRTGLGPLGFVLLPFAVGGAYAARHRLAASPLAAMALTAVLAYGLWMTLGPSQRVRHLLPVAPLALLPLGVAACRLAQARQWARAPLAAGLAATLALQLAGPGVFALAPLRHLVSGEDANSYLVRNVPGYPVLLWANQSLGAGDRLLLLPGDRALAFGLEVPHLLAHPLFQAQVRLDGHLMADLRAAAITHVVATPGLPAIDALVARGCLAPVREFQLVQIQSRTLRGLGAQPYGETAYRVAPDCAAGTMR
jgi:hypothetical protein